MKKRGSTSATKKRVGPASRRTASRPGMRVLYSDEQIRKRVRELAKQINRDYRGKMLHVVGILEKCFMFMADLTRALKAAGHLPFHSAADSRHSPKAARHAGNQVHPQRSRRAARTCCWLTGFCSRA